LTGGGVAVTIHCQKKQCHILLLKDKELKKRKNALRMICWLWKRGVLFDLLCFAFSGYFSFSLMEVKVCGGD